MLSLVPSYYYYVIALLSHVLIIAKHLSHPSCKAVALHGIAVFAACTHAEAIFSFLIIKHIHDYGRSGLGAAAFVNGPEVIVFFKRGEIFHLIKKTKDRSRRSHKRLRLIILLFP